MYDFEVVARRDGGLMNLETVARWAGALALIVVGAAAVGLSLWLTYTAYRLAGIFGLRHVRYLNPGAVLELGIGIVLGLGLFVFGTRLVLRRPTS
jgi:hypothetical protein